MPECQAFGCVNERGKVKDKSFFQIPNAVKFPEKRDLAIKWLHNIGTGNTVDKFTFGKHKVVCEDHFEPWCFETDQKKQADLVGYRLRRKTLVEDAYPTIFQHRTPQVDKAREAVALRRDIRKGLDAALNPKGKAASHSMTVSPRRKVSEKTTVKPRATQKKPEERSPELECSNSKTLAKNRTDKKGTSQALKRKSEDESRANFGKKKTKTMRKTINDGDETLELQSVYKVEDKDYVLNLSSFDPHLKFKKNRWTLVNEVLHPSEETCLKGKYCLGNHHDHQQGLGETMLQLWAKNLYHDLKLIVNDVSVSMHRLVLAAVSPLLRRGNCVKGNLDEVCIRWNGKVEARTLEAFVRYAYTGKLILTAKSVFGLKYIAKALEMRPLVDVCDAFIEAEGLYEISVDHPTTGSAENILPAEGVGGIPEKSVQEKKLITPQSNNSESGNAINNLGHNVKNSPESVSGVMRHVSLPNGRQQSQCSGNTLDLNKVVFSESTKLKPEYCEIQSSPRIQPSDVSDIQSVDTSKLVILVTHPHESRNLTVSAQNNTPEQNGMQFKKTENAKSSGDPCSQMALIKTQDHVSTLSSVSSSSEENTHTSERKTQSDNLSDHSIEPTAMDISNVLTSIKTEPTDDGVTNDCSPSERMLPQLGMVDSATEIVKEEDVSQDHLFSPQLSELGDADQSSQSSSVYSGSDFSVFKAL